MLIKRYRYVYLLMSIGLLYFLIFKYVPMGGIVIAFKNYKPWKGILESPWVGFFHFRRFFQSVYFVRLVRNTLMINLGKLLIGFPFPIIFALLLNELKISGLKKSIQTVTYLPHFLSWVVVGGLFLTMLSPSQGIINSIIAGMGFEKIHFMMEPAWFKPIIIITSIWKGFGWGSIVYLAAISGIDPQLYESSRMDGANRFQDAWHITLPQLTPIIVILLVLNLGKILNDDFQQILFFLQDNPALYEAGDVIETYVYRVGITGAEYSTAAAVGLFKNVIGLIMVLLVNKAAKKLGQEALW
jgi:putative aldouronate transport system permease protein